ncbi:MAG TPA: CBS domain-containing protein [Casimicrobiaceae bacterium]|nr:CBS domain-containing protein [Casimicrobiaceae bacterium]
MFDEPVGRVMQQRGLLKASRETLVNSAAKLMASRGLGAVLVVDGEQLVGIFTERDIAFRVVARDLDAQTTRLAEVMTPAPETVDPDKPFGYALLRMQEGGFRHLPVVSEGKIVGIVSARSAMDPALEEFVSEGRRRERYRDMHDQPAKTPTRRPRRTRD